MFDIRAKIFLPRLQLLTLILIPAVAQPQTTRELKEMFAQAESHYLYGEYELANPIYLSLASFQPDNNNFNYKIGNCYLNITDEKTKGIEYLEKAVKNSSYEAKPESFKEKRAPLDAYFSLARAYMINNELDKAISTLEMFQKLITETKEKGGMENIEFIEQQILACKNAIHQQENPVTIDKLKMPPEFSQGSVNDNPAISFDGNTIAYTERRGISNAIFYSKKERGKWQPPVEITYEINAGEDCSTCSLNEDGTELFLYKEDMEDGNIYSSKFKDGKWGPVRKLNSNINSKFYESHASISSDGKRLYFTSNRGDGMNLDIYVSELDASGEWGIPKKLDETVNSRFNEETPFITRDDTILYFSSEGHISIGGYDIFRSFYRNSAWQKPENVGYPINSTDDDLFYAPVNNGLNAYFTMPTAYKKREIIYLGIGVPAIDVFFDIQGRVSLNDSLSKPDESNKIYLMDLLAGDTISIAFPVRDSGNYRFTVNPGKFRLVYTGINYISRSVDTTLARDKTPPVVNIDVTLDKVPEPITYEKIDLSKAPVVSNIDTAILVTGMKVNDVGDAGVADTDVLYYTVQVMALYNPVDISYFKHINDMKVIYNDIDRFYRYTTGRFNTREEALAWKAELIQKGYPNDIFIKKVSK